MLEVIVKKRADDAVNLALLALGDWICVHVRIHEGVEEIDRLLHVIAHLNFSAAAVFNEVEHDRINPLTVALAAARADHVGNVLCAEYSGADGVVKVMIYVRYAVGKANDGRLGRVVRRAVRVMQDAHARFIAQVKPPAVALEDIDNAQRLLIVLEALFVYFVERALAGVTKRRVSQIVAQRHCLGEILV